MIEVVRTKQCGNSPKSALAQEWVIALETGGVEQVRALCSDSFFDETNLPPVDLESFLSQIESEADRFENLLAKLEISMAITHGKFAVVSGAKYLADGTGLRFCYTLEFETASCRRLLRLCRYGAESKSAC